MSLQASGSSRGRWARAVSIGSLLGVTAAGAAALWLYFARQAKRRRRAARNAAGGPAVPSLAEEIREALEREAAEQRAELPSEDLQARFAAAAAWVGSEGGAGLSTDAKLTLYGCYKQVSAGDAPWERPWGMEASMKWDAWRQHHGTSRGEAMGMYVDALDSLVPGWESSEGAAAPSGGKQKPDGSNGFGTSVSTMGRLGDPDQADDVDETPVGQLCEKIADGDVKEASAILARHPDLAFQKDKDGMTPLHWAADRGEVEVARVLIEIARRKPAETFLACLNAGDENGDAALHYAVNTDNVELARLLVTAGADPSAKNNDGESPESLAEGQEEWDSVFNHAT